MIPAFLFRCPACNVRCTPRLLFTLVVVVQSMSSVLMTPEPPPTSEYVIRLS